LRRAEVRTADSDRRSHLPDVGERDLIDLMFGVGSTVNGTPLLAMPPSVTTTLPVVAPLGTLTVIEPAAQLATLVTAVPLNLTVLVPCGEPKPDPEIVIEAPTGPEDAESPVMLGADTPVKVGPLLATPLTVTTTGPVLAPLGTGTPIDPASQLHGVAELPRNHFPASKFLRVAAPRTFFHSRHPPQRIAKHMAPSTAINIAKRRGI
jgi:hypothetical protein